MRTTMLRHALCSSVLLISGLPAAFGEVRLSDAELRARLDRYLDRAAAEGFTGAVLVAREGRILAERGYGWADAARRIPVAADTVFSTGSITKQFTAAAILVLEQRGKLAIGDPITRFFDHVPADKQGITLDLLLSHRAGFPGAIGDDLEHLDRDAFVARALSTPLDFAPGTGYQYSNVGFSLAAAIIEKVSGLGYESFLREALFAPAGMHDTGYRLPRWDARRLAHGVRPRDGGDWGTMVDVAIGADGPGWNLLGNGAIESTVGDIYRWDRALRGDRILTAASKAKMYARHAREKGESWYGYGWSIEPTEWGEMVTHDGGNGIFFSDLLRFLDSDVVVYYSTSSLDPRMKRLARPLARLVFTGEAPALEPKAPPLREPGADPAPAGSVAARWGLPGTPAGERAALLLDALAAPEPTSRERFAREGFADDVVARRGLERLAGLLERMRGDLGTFRVRGYRVGAGGELVVVLAPGGGPGPMQIELTVEPEAPHRISGIGVTLGD